MPVEWQTHNTSKKAPLAGQEVTHQLRTAFTLLLIFTSLLFYDQRWRSSQ